MVGASDVCVIDKLSDQHVQQYFDLLQTCWWSASREFEPFRKCLQHSLSIGLVLKETHELIGAARVCTDYVYKGLVLDVVIKESLRQNKLGGVLLQAIVDHELLARVDHLELYALEKHVSFYERVGFRQPTNGVVFLRKSRSPELNFRDVVS